MFTMQLGKLPANVAWKVKYRRLRSTVGHETIYGGIPLTR
jgi:hypothetical protein